jgi:hypothetical protein
MIVTYDHQNILIVKATEQLSNLNSTHCHSPECSGVMVSGILVIVVAASFN